MRQFVEFLEVGAVLVDHIVVVVVLGMVGALRVAKNASEWLLSSCMVFLVQA